MSAKFLTVFEMPTLQHVHLNKDVGQIGYHIGKMYGVIPEILTLEADEKCINAFQEAGVNVRTVNQNWINWFPRFRLLLLYVKLVYIAHQYSFIMFFHNRPSTLLINILLCKLNPSVVTYLKLDLDLYNEEYLVALCKNSKKRIRTKLYQAFLKYSFNLFRCVSVESERAFTRLRPLFKNLIHVRNGASELYFDSNQGIDRSSRRIAVVGRLSDPQKNILYMLDVIEQLKIKDLEFILVGHTSSEIRKRAMSVGKLHANNRITVNLTGEVSCTKKLIDIYDSCGILLSTSLFEGFPLAYCEASARGLYIATTPVGCESDFVGNNEFGLVLPADDVQGAARSIERLFEQNTVNSTLNEAIQLRARSVFRWNAIVPYLWQRLND